MAIQFINSQKAAELIPDNAVIALDGFLGTDTPEEILECMRARYKKKDILKD